ncbi:MAG: 50S ribosomal protein L11 methyltransferase [Planctomycetota bacterium]|nr:50S ribosomal protein L11 methyltransferase [Planctomycetota bacterium]
MLEMPDGRKAGFVSESGLEEPDGLVVLNERVSVVVVLRWLREGKSLLWEGGWEQGMALLKKLRSQIQGDDPGALDGSPLERWRNQRAGVRQQGQLLGGILVAIEKDGEVRLRGAPDARRAVKLAWGLSNGLRVVALNTLMGALSAAEWTRKGIEVPGLKGKLRPRFGVFSPTRRAYVDLLVHMDVGCGTGVLGFVLLQRGAVSALGTDLDPRSVECAIENAGRLGLQDRFQARTVDLFPPGERFDCVVFNAPWVPEVPRTRLDRAVFDEGGETLGRFVEGLGASLTEGGVGAILISDLPERLGLREEGYLEKMAAAAGLVVRMTADVPASHGRARDGSDPLHEIRKEERVRIVVMDAG